MTNVMFVDNGVTPAYPGDLVRLARGLVPPGRDGVQVNAGFRGRAGRQPPVIRNRANGAAAVTNPTFWPLPATLNGVTRTLVNSGVIGGEAFIDVRWQGTATTFGVGGPYQGTNSRALAAPGQVWTASLRAQRIAGSTEGITGLRLSVIEETAPSTIVGSTHATDFTGADETLLTVSRTIASGNQARIDLPLIAAAVGAVIDVTFRIRGLQLELGPTRTAWQANMSAFDITEAGQPSLAYYQFDSLDDRLEFGPFPGGFSGQLVLFTPAGVWRESGVAVAPGGLLTLGPVNGPGGTANLFVTYPRIFGAIPRAGSFTDAELDRLLAFAAADGLPVNRLN